MNPNATWQRYVQLERIQRLKDEGRELLGEVVYVQPKRDGENISVWLNGTDSWTPHISSHNMVDAESNLINRFTTTPEFTNATLLLRTEREKFGQNLILYGELVNAGKGATRIEPLHKNAHWYLFDIYDIDKALYYPYPLVYQTAYHYHLPLIEALETWTPQNMQDIQTKIVEWKRWAKRHRREGVVGKLYKNGVLTGFKEKIDLPKLAPISRVNPKPTLPPMDDHTILRALQHAIDTVGKQNWESIKLAMPELAKQLETEGREHHFHPPRNMYQVYLDSLQNNRYKNL
jgi:hypothetical protein